MYGYGRPVSLAMASRSWYMSENRRRYTEVLAASDSSGDIRPNEYDLPVKTSEMNENAR